MAEVRTVTDAVIRARDELVKMNGITGVIMLQIESANLINYEKNNKKPTWKIICSYYTNMSGTERVRKEVFIDKETGELVDLNGEH